MMRGSMLLYVLLSCLVLATTLGAAVPQLLNVQGLLTDENGDPVADGVYTTAFKIYGTAEGGDVLWQEFGTVTTKDGLFSTVLGQVTPLTADIFDNSELWLGIAVAFESEMTPRQRLTSVPFAFKSEGSGNSYWYEADSMIYVLGNYGLSRGGVDNAFLGGNWESSINFGVQCTTGVAGFACPHATISGGWRNNAGGSGATIGGGEGNRAEGSGTIGGGNNNKAGNLGTVSGGGGNEADAYGAAISGGIENEAGTQSFVGGGTYNNAIGANSVVGGGHENSAGGIYSAILGGYSNYIQEGADFSYLFGINSNLSADSTFQVDMPHIRFGDGNSGYEFPAEDGAAGQVMVTDGDGLLNWASASASGGWTDEGQHVRLTTTADSVGIGTDSPQAKLHVQTPSTTAKLGQSSYAVYGEHPMSFSYGYLGASNIGAFGYSDDLYGVQGATLNGKGVYGSTSDNFGVGVYGENVNGNYGYLAGKNYAVYASAASGYAGWFDGKVYMNTSLGIGEPNPVNKLDVSGNAVIGSSYSGSSTGPANGLAVQGRVGIGTESPSSPLEVKGDNPEITVNTTAAGALAGIRLQDNGSTQWSMAWNRGSQYLYFYHNASPAGTRLIISDTSGYVGIGEGNPAYRLDVNGDIECATLHQTSDDRLKTDVEQLANVLDKLQAIHGVSFAWNEEARAHGAEPGERKIGVLASEVEAVFPELVSRNGEGYRSVEYANLVAVLIEAVKELRSDNEELRQRVVQLERESKQQ